MRSTRSRRTLILAAIVGSASFARAAPIPDAFGGSALSYPGAAAITPAQSREYVVDADLAAVWAYYAPKAKTLCPAAPGRWDWTGNRVDAHSSSANGSFQYSLVQCPQAGTVYASSPAGFLLCSFVRPKADRQTRILVLTDLPDAVYPGAKPAALRAGAEQQTPDGLEKVWDFCRGAAVRAEPALQTSPLLREAGDVHVVASSGHMAENTDVAYARLPNSAVLTLSQSSGVGIMILLRNPTDKTTRVLRLSRSGGE